jgi:amidophosphoribosyltransferase
MSEFISHECGIALVRLKQPLAYYQEKYGTPLWGFQQLFLLMEKQHNRGQDGAGVACVKFDVPAGEPYMFRERNVETNPIRNFPIPRKRILIFAVSSTSVTCAMVLQVVII